MASLTRKFLSALGLDDDKVDQVIERHNEVVTEIKEERDKLKSEAERLPEIQKQLDAYKEAEQKAEKDPYKVKYEAMKEEFENFKNDIEKKETASKKEKAYRQLLKDCGVNEKRLDAVMKVTDTSKLEFDEEGKLKDGDKLKEAIKTEWADFIQTTGAKGAATATPPANNGGKTTMTKEQIRAIPDAATRQKAMLDNPGLFGLPEN